MSMTRRKNAVAEFPPYHLNPHISFIDLYFKKELVKPGTLLTLKNDRNIYVFERMCFNSELKTEWVDLRSQTNGDWKSVRVDRIKGLYIAKKSRAKKVNAK